VRDGEVLGWLFVLICSFSFYCDVSSLYSEVLGGFVRYVLLDRLTLCAFCDCNLVFLKCSALIVVFESSSGFIGYESF